MRQEDVKKSPQQEWNTLNQNHNNQEQNQISQMYRVAQKVSHFQISVKSY